MIKSNLSCKRAAEQVPPTMEYLIKVSNCLQIWLLILSKFKQINEILFPQKSSENRFSNGFSGNRG